MSKPHINKHNRKPINHKRFAQLLRQHLHDTGLATAYVDPPFTVEEQAQARYLASQLQASYKDNLRVGALVTILQYRSAIQGVVNFVERPPAAKPEEVA